MITVFLVNYKYPSKTSLNNSSVYSQAGGYGDPWNYDDFPTAYSGIW